MMSENSDYQRSIKELIGEENFNKISHILDKMSKNKRKRSKNAIPDSERCLAKKNGGQQCSRRRREGSDFCGTHIKGSPHGKVNKVNNLKKVEVYAENIKGIIYYIDDNCNIYDTQDVYNNKTDPSIIGKCKKLDNGEYTLIT